MNAIDRIREETKTLSEDQRLTLAHRLLILDQPPPTEEVETAWDLEIRDRIRRHDEGESLSRDARKVFEDLDHRLSR